jgi:hypothetical protein
MAHLLALLIGLALGYALARDWTPRPKAKARTRSLPQRQRVNPAQLQAWIEAAPVGWISLDSELRIQEINPGPRACRSCQARSSTGAACSSRPWPWMNWRRSPGLAQAQDRANGWNG